jgi:adenylate cyclase class 2
MSDGPLETEVKFRVERREALEERLRALGATHEEVENEVNLLLDDDEMSLRVGGRALRVRTVDGLGLLTFKGPASFEGGIKSRLELESGVDDPGAVLALFDGLGYRPRFRYEKRRTTWRFDDPARPLFVLDETPLGLFAEIEGGTDAILALAAELAVPESAFLHSSYWGLWQAAREVDPGLPHDMLFAR